MSSLLNPSENVCQDSCDICEDEKPQWYCAADEAYLCDDCDLSVHGVNSLALTYERVTLNCSDYEVAHVPHSSPGANDFLKIKHEPSNIYDSCRNMKETASLQKPKKDRSTDESLSATSSTQDSYVKNGNITYTRATKVEFNSQFQEEHKSCDFSMGYHKYWKSSENCLFVYEVPVLVPVAQEMPTMNRQDAPKQVCPSFFGATNLEDSSTCDFMEFLVPEICDVDNYIISNTDFVGNEEKANIVKAEEAVAGNELVEEKMCCQLKGNESALEFSLSNKTQQSILHDHYERYYDQSMNDIRLEYLELNVLKRSRDKPKADCTETFVPLAKVCEKLKVEYTEEADQIGQHLEALIEQSFHIINKEARNQKSFLRLNYEDVVSAWSDRGCFWTDDQWPRTIPPDSTSNPLEEASLDVGIVPDLEAESMKSPDQKDDDGREARVLRYREKRQTRLFSKKVRYEVRKLNAEKRPRVKGRFVKRSS